MSKNIWHTADEAPSPYKSFVVETDKGNVYTGITTDPTEWNPIILPEFYSIGDIDKAERAIRYAYLDDLLELETELTRTRKALDLAKDTLCWYDNNYDSVVAQNTLDEIRTTLEQKDVK